MAMKEHMRYKADTTPPRSRTQNISLCFLISISAVIFKDNAQTHIHFPRDLGESLTRRRRRSAFIYRTFHQSVFYSPYFIPSPQSVVRSPCFTLTAINSFMHITYYTTTRKEIKPATKLKESKSKCSSSRQV